MRHLGRYMLVWLTLAVSAGKAATEAQNAAITGPFDGHPVVVPQGPVDRLMFSRLRRLEIQPAAICSDAVFVRRVYLDTVGTIPSAEEARAFLEDTNPGKRNALIDQLLARDAFADYWSMKWCDLLRVKSEFPIDLWPNAVQAYHRWIHTSLKQNKPYDLFVRELLTASGSNFHDPQVNFYRAVQRKEPRILAQTVALTFMGSRTDQWPEKQQADMALFFSQVGYKSTAEWKEEIIFFDTTKASNAFFNATFPDGTTVRIDAGKDPREVFADWLIQPKNPWFARNIVNRIGFWLLGRGMLAEPDNIQADSTPNNPQLLAYLERELIAHRYQLKEIYRQIMQSQAYQLSCLPRTEDPRAEAEFAYYPVRRLEAEVLIDMLDQITGTTESYTSPIPEPFTFIPEDQNSVCLADASITSPFLELFGRSPRDSGLESERNSRPTAAQCLHLLNSSHIQRKLEQSAKLKALLQSKDKPRDAVDELYLTILSRHPTESELSVLAAYRQANANTGRRIGIDLAWALINSAEFQYRH